MVLVRPSPERVHHRFLRYWLNCPFLATHIHGYRDGSVAERLNLPTIRALPVPLPPVDQQTTIADVLGSLDDKIEVSRHTDRVLERVAAAIFKAWFVDFEPVHAKATGAGGFSLVPQHVFSDLPSSFTRSPLGSIPSGWQAGTFSELASLSRDTVDPGSRPTAIYEHFSIPSYDEGRVPKRERGAEIKSNKVQVIPGSVLVSKLNPRIPRVWLPSPPSAVQQIASTEFLVVVPRSASSREYLYCLARSEDFRDEFASRVTGTSGSHQRVKADDLLSIRVLLAPESVMTAFKNVVGPMFSLIEANRQESAVLASMRDMLLPKLLSGEVRLRETGATLHQAV